MRGRIPSLLPAKQRHVFSVLTTDKQFVTSSRLLQLTIHNDATNYISHTADCDKFFLIQFKEVEFYGRYTGK